VIVVDTSVLVPILRSASEPDTSILWQLIDADLVSLPLPVRQEIRAGLATRDRARVLSLLSELPIGVPSEETWRRVETWTDEAGAAGQRFGLANLTIAALAAELDALIWTYDTDFERMEKLRFVRLFQPRSSPRAR
jgi:predicted nucleic acid-binding protein